jgi:hypothetical protein
MFLCKGWRFGAAMVRKRWWKRGPSNRVEGCAYIDEGRERKGEIKWW